MLKNFKRILATVLAATLIICLTAPVFASASGAMYSVEVFVESGGHVIRERYMYNPGDTVVMRALPFEGYSFYSWASEDINITNPDVDTLQFTMPAKDVMIIALFALVQDAAKDTVNVTFDTMGGTAFEGVDVIVGECLAEPATNPAKEGYNFDGWYSDAQCTLPFNFAEPIYTSTIVYAKWAKVQESKVANTFSDVKDSDWFYTHVMTLAEKNIISGMGKNSKGELYFAPQNNITRAQFVKILLNMAGENLYKDLAVSEIFDDVKDSAWYAEAVAWAYSMGVANGTGDKKFSPESKITRQDMAVMISNYVKNVEKKSLPDSVEKIEFADNDEIAGYAISSIEDMQRAGIISGRSSGDEKIFAPRAYATRAETSKMIDVLISLF